MKYYADEKDFRTGDDTRLWACSRVWGSSTSTVYLELEGEGCCSVQSVGMLFTPEVARALGEWLIERSNDD